MYTRARRADRTRAQIVAALIIGTVRVDLAVRWLGLMIVHAHMQLV